MKIYSYAVLICLMIAAPAFATVAVSSPTNGQTVGSPATFVATATTNTCSRGVASMGIYIDNSLKYVHNGTSLNTTLSLSPGSYHTVIEEWDYCGGATYTPLAITVADQPDVMVIAPANNSTVSSPVNFAATATTSSCSRGVASMGVYVNNQLVHVETGAKLNTQITLGAGAQHTVVEEWDNCGGASYTPVNVTVADQVSVPSVIVTSPENNSTVSPLANYIATATTNSCSRGVASIGVYVNNQLVHVENGANLNTQITLGTGTQHTVVEEWDYCGGASYTPVNVTVIPSITIGTVIPNIQTVSGNWKSWGQGAPDYVDCSPSPCNGFAWSMGYGISSPSLSGNATKFHLGGTVPYGDTLFSAQLVGQNSPQIPDTNHTLLPTMHNFIYDTNVFVTNYSITQSLEFDISMYMNGVGMIWGTQCDHLGDGAWDIWDNVNAHWISSGVTCNLKNNSWNHVTIQVQRESDNTLLYQSITVNGVTANINKSYAPYTVSSSWWGMTVNFQMDGNYNQSENTTYLDNFSLRYW